MGGSIRTVLPIGSCPGHSALAVPALTTATLALASPALAGEAKHRLAIHVDQNDAQVMNLALNNATNVIEYYRSKNEDVDIDIVTYGPGLHMLRADTSPVKDMLRILRGVNPNIRFVVCEVTKLGMGTSWSVRTTA